MGVLRGWANLDQAEPLTPEHRFPAYGITHPVTATTILRLVASGRVDLDRPANAYLQSFRLADAAVTVRELLTHTGGVDHPIASVADAVPDLIELLGPVITCNGQRGMFRYSNEGYGVLGQLIADVTGTPYLAAVDRLVFAPLGMNRSSFPTRWPAATPNAVTGYQVGGDGIVVPEPPLVATIAAAGGMWSTPQDLVRFGTGWATLLPSELVAEALAPHTTDPRRDADSVGLGWHVERDRTAVTVAGTGPGAATSMLVRTADGRALVALSTPRTSIATTTREIRRALDRSGRTHP